MGGPLAPFKSFIEDASGEAKSLVVVNRTRPEPVQGMVEDLFTEQPIEVEELITDEKAEDEVVLADDSGAIARSALAELEDTLLFVNSDIYITGTVGLESFELPDVIAAMDETPFTVRGYPTDLKEKFLLTVISRMVEHTAWQAGDGRIRASFQRLSRIEDERGTQDVYEKLTDTDLDVHVYGVPDAVPSLPDGMVAHAGTTKPFRKVWFVVYVPEHEEEEHVALLAVEGAESEHWQGFFTYRRDLVTDIERHIERTM